MSFCVFLQAYQWDHINAQVCACTADSFNENLNGHFHTLINAASLCSKKDNFSRFDKQFWSDIVGSVGTQLDWMTLEVFSNPGDSDYSVFGGFF